MKRFTLSGLLLLLVLSRSLSAAGVTLAGSNLSGPQAQAAELPAKLILKEGTDVKLKFAQPSIVLSSSIKFCHWG